jgi:hypothetical protein
MAAGETHHNIGDMIRTAASEGTKAGAPMLVPWRIEANQDHLYKGLELCGCAFAPDEPEDQMRP